MSKFNFRKRLY